MNGPRQRSATISDAMILVVGAAFAFASWRSFASMPIWDGVPDSPQRIYFQALGGVAFLAPLSLALLVVALRRPGRRRRRALGSPAGVVGLSTCFVLAVNAVLLAAVVNLAGTGLAASGGDKILYFCRLAAEQTGMAIGSAWTAQLLNGRCVKPTGWIDASAWAVGSCWILLALASIAFTLM